jgi:DNA (cytosine-5)-methyltransferase 1
MTAYYNEIDPYAAQWLRNLIAAGHIAPGDVDERSILEVQPDDLRGYDQCHFFAGIGGWSHALRLAGWPDDRPVWTGSCPCQPFSAAGKQRGSDDERHLWPAFFDLIRECGPASVFGEQVAGAAGLAWLDHVCADLEGAGYAAAAADLCAAGAGAFHIRQRLYWVAHADRRATERRGYDLAGAADDCGLAYADGGNTGAEREQRSGQQRQQPQDGSSGLLGNAGSERLEIERRFPGVSRGASGAGARQAIERADPLAAWADIEWIECSDGKARPTQPGLFPLAHGIPNRVGRLRAYGNAIVPQVAAVFVMANV